MESVKLFGTDGIRGKANHFPILPEVIVKVGQALGVILNRTSTRKRKMALIGKDTRLSGYMLEQALASGLNSMGVWVQLTGPLPTPGIGFLAHNMRVSAGVVISASHNLYQDNGIKIFGPNGLKIPFEMEREIENLVADKNWQAPSVSEVGRTRRIDDASGRYIVFVKSTFPRNLTLEGVKLVLDCAHGAGYKTAPAIFEELGAEVIVIGNQPNGYNINKDCGALCWRNVQKKVLEHKAHAGISLDGDGDRVVMVDETGRLVGGDHILGISALHLSKTKSLKKIVSTQMANTGLESFLNAHGMELLRVEVGDKNVTSKMSEVGAFLGGEPSGHIIFSEHSYTGDACIAALNVLAVMILENKKLSQLRQQIKNVPQVIDQIPVKTKTQLELLPGYEKLTQKVQQELKGGGRFYVRFSGTEPLARVMVEGQDEKKILHLAKEISSFLQSRLN